MLANGWLRSWVGSKRGGARGLVLLGATLIFAITSGSDLMDLGAQQPGTSGPDEQGWELVTTLPYPLFLARISVGADGWILAGHRDRRGRWEEDLAGIELRSAEGVLSHPAGSRALVPHLVHDQANRLHLAWREPEEWIEGRPALLGRDARGRVWHAIQSQGEWSEPSVAVPWTGTVQVTTMPPSMGVAVDGRFLLADQTVTYEEIVLRGGQVAQQTRRHATVAVRTGEASWTRTEVNRGEAAKPAVAFDPLGRPVVLFAGEPSERESDLPLTEEAIAVVRCPLDVGCTEEVSEILMHETIGTDQVRAAFDHGGVLHAAWRRGAGAIWYARSSDGGVSWTEPQELVSSDGVAVTGRTIVIAGAGIGHEVNLVATGDRVHLLFVARSSDGSGVHHMVLDDGRWTALPSLAHPDGFGTPYSPAVHVTRAPDGALWAVLTQYLGQENGEPRYRTSVLRYRDPDPAR